MGEQRYSIGTAQAPTIAAPCELIRRADSAYPPELEQCLRADAPDHLVTYGAWEILRFSLVAIFASIRTPASLILKGLDAARMLRAAEVPVVGGFQSPLEREMLRLLVRGNQRLAICSARNIERMRIPRPWRSPLLSGRMLIVGAAGLRWRRPTVRTAAYRNRLVSALADSIFVVHAHPGSRTFRTVVEALDWGRTVYCFDHSGNRDLVLLGAQPVADLASFPFGARASVPDRDRHSPHVAGEESRKTSTGGRETVSAGRSRARSPSE